MLTNDANCATKCSCVNYVTFAARFPDVTFYRIWAQNVMARYILSYDVASESEITPCNKIDKPLVVYRFTGNVMTFITTLRT